MVIHSRWSINVLSLFLIYDLAYFVTSLQIIVQFDGSLRPPNDFGSPTFSLGRMAACACTISRITVDSDEPRLLAIGGKRLNVTSTMTSGEAEYEGLLFALRSLRTFIERQNKSDVTLISSISISGDCKTIIDQMNGKSNARKMEQFYLRALAEVDALAREPFHDTLLGKLRFYHIPRTKNIICDKISASIIMHEQHKAYDGVWSDLLNNEGPGGCSIDLIGILDKWFVHQKSFLPLSRRPSLYRYMAELAIKKRDFVGLREVGSRYENDVRELERNSGKGNKPVGVNTDALNSGRFTTSKAEAISYQIFSLHALGLKNEASQLRTRNRFLLNLCSSTVVEVEKQLAGTDTRPNKATALLLEAEKNSVDFTHSQQLIGWPVHVQQWYDEMILSQPWENHQELLFEPKQLTT